MQAPGNAQNYNRYSYCLNNPLMFTDPTGYINISWDEWWRKIFGGPSKKNDLPSWNNFSTSLGFRDTKHLLAHLYISQAVMTFSTIAGNYVGGYISNWLYPLGTSSNFSHWFTFGGSSGFTRGFISGFSGNMIFGNQNLKDSFKYGLKWGWREGAKDAITYGLWGSGLQKPTFLQVILLNNVSDNIDIDNINQLRLHFTFLGIEIDGWNLYWIGSNGLSNGQRFDMLFERSGVCTGWGCGKCGRACYSRGFGVRPPTKTLPALPFRQAGPERAKPL